jgi:Flp pilus assembly protein TadD
MASLKRKKEARSEESTARVPTVVIRPRRFSALLGIRIFPLFIAAAGLFAFHNSFAGTFIFDDLPAIEDNPAIRHLWPFNGTDILHSGSLVALSLSLNHALGGMQSWGYHHVNLFIHILAGLTLYGVVRRSLLMKTGGARSPDAAACIAVVTALIWVVHPLQTESVTYIIQRSESMAGLFYLLTLYCTLRGAEPPGRSRWWYGAAVATCALGMASKEVMVTAPVVLLLYDRVFLSDSLGQALHRRWGLYVGLIVTWSFLAGRVTDLFNFGRAGEATVGFVVRGITPWQYALTQPEIILHYLWLTVWPINQCLDYGWPAVNDMTTAMRPALLIGALLGLTLWALRRRPGLGFCGASFFLILAPTSSFVPLRDLAFEHRMYLPLAAIILLMVLGASALWKGFSPRLISNSFGRACTVGVLVGVVVVVLSLLTIRRNEDYRSAMVMWTDVVAKRPGNPRGHNNVGSELLLQGRVNEGIPHLLHAIRLRPDYARAHYNLGTGLLRLGRFGEATVALREAILFEPNDDKAHHNLGNCLFRLAQVPEAVVEFREAIRITPDFADAHSNLGNALLTLGKVEEAIRHIQEALRLDPRQALFHNILGLALVRQQNMAGAIEHFREALRLAPNLDFVDNNLGLAYLRRGELKEATSSFKRTVVRQPRDAAYRRNLAFALHRQGEHGRARAEYQTSLQLEPKWPESLIERAWLLATHPESGRRDGLLAVICAEQVVQAQGDQDAGVLDTLAAAYAEAKQFDKAVEAARRALKRAQSAEDQTLAHSIQERLSVYRQRKPFRAALTRG